MKGYGDMLKGRLIVRQWFALLLAIVIIWSCEFPIGRAQEVPVESPTPLPEIEKSEPAELHQALLDLANPWTVMCVAAHPDDEDGTTLTVLRRKYGIHTVTLFSTYGEGGQNVVGPELYEELGVIRAKETIRASEIQGSEPHFLGLKEFGFSKSDEETFRIWNREEALRLMVLKIRALRPDVIITNHDTSRGHGHHQATGQLIIEAFTAAADPKRFPEQLSALKTWQAQRLFVRQPGGAAAANQDTVASKIVSIDPNEIDPVRGTSFAEQALQALHQHATQGPWPKSVEDMMRARRITGGKLPPIRYRLEREAPNTTAPSGGLETFVDGLKPRAAPPLDLDTIAVNGKQLPDSISQPDRVLDELIKWRVEKQADSIFQLDSESSVGKAFARAAGISLALMANEPLLIPGQKSHFTITLSNNGTKPVKVTKLSFAAFGKESSIEPPDHLLNGTETSVAAETQTPMNARYTVPQAEHLYDGALFGLPFKATVEIDLEGAKFQISTIRTVDVAPAIEIVSISPSPCVRTEETLGRCRELSLQLANHTGANFRGIIKTRIDRAAGALSEISRPLVMGPNEESKEAILTSNKLPRREDLRGLRRSRTAVVSIYSSANNLITERKVELIYSSAQVKPNVRVGYLPSFDKTLEQSLAALGVESTALKVEDVKSSDLSSFGTIILDNRAYEAHQELVASNSRLLEFVNAGGTLIVFYHRTNEWNPDPNKTRPQLAPFPIILGDERVTDETAAVTFLQPRHPLMTTPNVIRQADFAGWIQERGLYYPKEWDKNYTELFSMSDKGEKPLRSGLLVTKYGKGNYIYTSMVWYRQLRAGVPGAYRMLANMISYSK
ncbi:MAG TPA: PIG-L family deacetylase [Pyrinomonadaceae bacterium]|nr:PIG-L family deacetylase [Pyrinomonadaceae bacterium]